MRRFLATAVTALAAAAIALPAVAAAEPVVRGVLFYSPTCPHCHVVIDEVLPVVFAEHGGAPEVMSDEAVPAFTLVTNGSLELLLVDVTTDAGGGLYARSTRDQAVPEQMLGVPRLVIGGDYYVGSADIPQALPGILEDGLAAGGIDWPAIEGVDDALAALAVSATPTTTATDPGTTTTAAPTTDSTVNPFEELEPSGPGTEVIGGAPPASIGEKFRSDLAGNTLAVMVLAGMVASLALVFALVRRDRLAGGPAWLIPLLAVAGALVAVYLTYVETSGSEAVCGPVGNCNAVQESKFALLFGVIPVGVVGLAGYALVAGGWLAARLTDGRWSDRAFVALAAGSLGGVVFSIYLTFLEPFVIGATCIWCLSSAVIVTALFWLSADPGWSALQRLRSRR